MTDKINIIKMNGTNIQAELICLLENVLTRRQFVFYTLNEIMGAQPNSTVKIYVSKIAQNDPSLDNPISDNEWAELKGIMGEVLKGIKNPNLKYFKAEPTIGLSCVSDKAIAMPTSYDYVSKHKAVYLESLLAPIQEVISEPEIVNKTNIITEVPVSDIISTGVVNTEPSETSNLTPMQDIINTPIENEIIEPVIEPVVEEVAEPETTLIQEDTAIENGPVISEQTANDSAVNNYVNMEFIDIDEIETKYNEMFANLNKLKEQEIEAAKRYNATLELSAMHNEQHASYVASEQEKETPFTQINEPQAIVPVSLDPESLTQTDSDESSGINLETNWFDLPQN